MFCNICKAGKNENEFYKRYKRCKKCHNGKTREYYKQNKENIKIKTKKYSNNNKEKISQQKKEYRINNKEKIGEKNRVYYKKNKEVIIEKMKQYHKCRYYRNYNVTIKTNYLCCNCNPNTKQSHGELEIQEILKNNNIQFIKQYKFPNQTKEISRCRYDFYLPEINTIIEFHGIQHYKFQ